MKCAHIVVVLSLHLAIIPRLNASEIMPEPAFIEPDAAHSDRLLRIPEPMVYDLVRPLGVRQGEMEINALGDYNPYNGDFSWAPELEYGLADDLAMEVELPFEDASHERYKVAIQQTLGVDYAQGTANGWQAFVDVNKHTKAMSADATYIHARQWTDQWSSLSMLGLRVHNINRSAQVDYLLNNTVFYDVSPRLTLGLELNQEISTGGTWRYRLTPQVHYDASQYYTLQMGTAWSTLDHPEKTQRLWSFRLIRVF
jgi:hypothetical protein